MKPCMGGWCRIRESCANYNAHHRAYPAERLCDPGKDGDRAVKVVSVFVNVPAGPVKEAA